MKRPSLKGLTQVTTPHAAAMMQLLGPGIVFKGQALTHDEFKAVNKLYGFKPEGPNKKPDPPPAPDPASFEKRWEYEEALRKHGEALKIHARWQDPQPLMQAGADHSAMRAAESDGLRLVAWLAKFVPPGEDPLAHLIQAVVAAGWDIKPEDIEWAYATEAE